MRGIVLLMDSAYMHQSILCEAEHTLQLTRYEQPHDSQNYNAIWVLHVSTTFPWLHHASWGQELASKGSMIMI